MWPAYEPGAMSRRVIWLTPYQSARSEQHGYKQISELNKNFDAVGWIGIINTWISLDIVLINVLILYRRSADHFI